ncbi:hypothetical protein BX666DRAFT_1933569 [Dichotomocladium elegans]|nr:hypothetical protein BX666DRAFT_1933569 [Dichotomocladium elegans]
MSKRKFHGEDELNDFVAKRRKPTFSAFMTRHLKDLPKWSTDLIHLDALELFSRWNRRFAKALIKCEKQHLLLSESSCKFDKERWSTISRIANDLTDVQLEYICGGTKLLREASSSVCAAASTMISSNSTIARDDSEATMGYPSAVARNASVKSKEVSKKVITISLDLPDLEQKVHEIAYDYFSGKGITKARQRELQAIMAMDCGDADCSLALIRLGAKHMLKEKKTAVTQAIIKLSISKIYNLIDSRFEVIYKSNVPPTVWSSVENKAKKMMCLDDGRHLSDDTIKLFDEIVEQQSSTAMLKLIDKKKYLLSSSDNEDTEAYTALLIVEQV